MNPVVLAAALAMLQAGQAQEATAPPQEVCLTNACAEALKLPKPATVQEAIVAGDGRRVRELGGSPAQVVEALKEEVRRMNPNPERAQATIDRLTQFADLANGGRLAFQDAHNGTQMRFFATGEDAGLTQWGIDRTNPDGSIQSIALLPQGGIFIGQPYKLD